eukprot:Hpha_TRINITY_DN26935_c0_g1::TRINITY_DN26935_c0_g1_i1::g.24925::m.24925
MERNSKIQEFAKGEHVLVRTSDEDAVGAKDVWELAEVQDARDAGRQYEYDVKFIDDSEVWEKVPPSDIQFYSGSPIRLRDEAPYQKKYEMQDKVQLLQQGEWVAGMVVAVYERKGLVPIYNVLRTENQKVVEKVEPKFMRPPE